MAASRPDVVCRRLLVRATGAGQHAGYTAIVTNIPTEELPALALEPFYEGRQTIEGWLSEATDALQLKGLWSRSFCGREAFLLHAVLTSNLLNWWERRALLPDSGLPHLGLRHLTRRVIAIPARVMRTSDRRLRMVLPMPECFTGYGGVRYADRVGPRGGRPRRRRQGGLLCARVSP